MATENLRQRAAADRVVFQDHEPRHGERRGDEKAYSFFDHVQGRTDRFIYMGVAQVLLGGMCVLSNMVYSMTWGTLLPYYGMPEIVEYLVPGVWVGLIIIAGGITGIYGGKYRSQGAIVFFMVMSILCSLAIWIILTTNMISFYHMSTKLYEADSEYMFGVVSTAIMIATALIEFVIAIVSAALCCGVLCCPVTISIGNNL